jgi:ankyrin repeat protein
MASHLQSSCRFRWVYCQLVYLRNCLPQRVRRALDDLPQTLDATYERTLQEINEQNWEFAHRLFHCVAVAVRPLRVEELAEFLAFEFDEEPTPTYLPDWRPEDPIISILTTCPSFLSIVDVKGSSVIQFAHFSIKEYLMSKRLAEAKDNDTLSRFHVSMTQAHTIVAQACLGVLLHMDETITESDMTNFPLAEYAAKHWTSHARFEGVSSIIQDGMKRLFDPNNRHLVVWAWVYDPEPRRRKGVRTKSPSLAKASPLHYAAFYGLYDIAKFLIDEHSQDVNARGFSAGETPIVVATRKGHPDIVRLLIKHGADMETRNLKGLDWNALDKAASIGEVDVLHVLLDHHANVNVQDRKNYTPLHCAAMYGQPAAAQVLLERGADIDPRDHTGRTPLYQSRGEDVARVLVKFGAETNARDNDNQTLLHLILEKGRSEIARVLLENGAEVNARNSKDDTPLHVASRRGDLDSLRVLLKYSADVHARNDDGQTPFEVASENDHSDAMQLLLEHGAEDPNKTEQATDSENKGGK